MLLSRKYVAVSTTSRISHRPTHANFKSARRPLRTCAAYDVDVDSERKAPNSAPQWGSSPPPPPPPPPPMPPTNNKFGLGNFKLPNGRDVLIAMLGAGIGVAGMFLYYEASIPDFTDADFEAIVAEEAINRILENDTDFLNALDAAIQVTFPDELLQSLQAEDAAAQP